MCFFNQKFSLRVARTLRYVKIRSKWKKQKEREISLNVNEFRDRQANKALVKNTKTNRKRIRKRCDKNFNVIVLLYVWHMIISKGFNIISTGVRSDWRNFSFNEYDLQVTDLSQNNQNIQLYSAFLLMFVQYSCDRIN